ncbi:hypothetical protein ABXV03_07100 [Streptomyces harbinensis]|uniref:hypothetical protein n=1 Tax=Streptomyces harbinensis TaxID=1176198 RepID=UPI003395E89D
MTPPVTRRTLFGGAAAVAGATAAGASLAAPAQAAETAPDAAAGTAGAGGPTGDWTEAELRDRSRVLRLGFTEQEADAWLLVARAGAAFFALPQLHPSDTPDVVDAVHVMQRILMQRPAYKQYRQWGEEEEGGSPAS